jgi:hypothetical protein
MVRCSVCEAYGQAARLVDWVRCWMTALMVAVTMGTVAVLGLPS